MPKDVIIACDFPSGEEALEFLEQFRDKKPYVKIGMELFYGSGPEIVRRIKDRGHKVFLDVKVHDIPNTVKRTMAVLGKLGVDMVNLHAAGTLKMMEEAKAGLMEGAARGGAGSTASGDAPLLIAVTQLTSTDQERMEKEILIERPIDEVVASYAGLARKAGLDGVVCSPLEAGLVHEVCGAEFLTVTPGIRFPEGAGKDDQKRITTPAGARRLGSDFIVVGRPITGAEDPVEAYEKCVREFMNGEEEEHE